MKRNVTIEFLRIIAIFMVIGTHVKLGSVVDGSPVFFRVLIACFVGDGVAIFWMILGCFFFDSDDYLKKIKNMCKRILGPLLIFSILMFYFYDYIVGIDSTILESIKHSGNEYKALLVDGLLKWQNVISGCGHLWYLYVYCLVITMFPVFKGIRNYISEIKNGDLKLFCLLFVLLAFNDCSFNGFFEFSHHTFGGVLGAGVWVLLGSVLYRNRSLFEGKIKYGFIGLIIFGIGNVFRAIIQCKCYLLDNKTEEPLFWFTGYAVISVLGLWISVLGFSKLLNKKNISEVILHLGKMTFPVYIIHFLVRDYICSKGWSDELYNRFDATTRAGMLKYLVVFVLLVFVISLSLSELYIIMKKIISHARNLFLFVNNEH